MSEERFWNTDEYASTAKFAVQDGAMTMRQAAHSRILCKLQKYRKKSTKISIFERSVYRPLNCIIAESGALVKGGEAVHLDP